MRRGSFSSAILSALIVCGIAIPLLPTAYAQQGEFDIQKKCENDFVIAMEYWRNRQIPDAHELFTTVVEACPDFVTAYEYKGRCESDMKQYGDAVRTFRDGLDVDPDNVSLRIYLAYVLFVSQDFTGAVGIYRSLLDDDPDNVDYWVRMADASQKSESMADAVMAASQALSVRPDSLGLWKTFDHYLLINRHIVPSIQTSERIYLRDPGNVNVMSRLAGAYAKVKNYAKAVVVYEEIDKMIFPEDGSEGIEFSGKRAQDLWLYATALKKVGDIDRAVVVFEKVMGHEKYANDVNALVNFAFLLKDAKRSDDCVRISSRALEVDPANCAAQCAKGKGLEGQALALEKQKQFDAAIQKIMEARHLFQQAAGCANPTWQKYGAAEVGRMDEHITRLNQRKSQAD